MTPKVGIFRIDLFKTSETFIVNQAKSLQRYSPIFIGQNISGAPPSSLSYKLAKGGFGSGRLINSLLPPSPAAWDWRELNERPKLIHAHFGIDAVQAASVADYIGVPLIVTLHGFDVTRTLSSFLLSGRPNLMRYALRREILFQKASRFLCVSEFIRQQAIDAGFPKEKLIRHYVGMRLPDHARSSSQGKYFLHIARLVEKKGTADLLRAYQAARIAGCVSPLLIVGDGPLRSKLSALVCEMGLGESVRFLGALPNGDTLQILESATALVVPSVTARNGDREGLPTVILEAFARQIPVIGYDSGGIAEAVRPGLSGWLHPEGDIRGLSNSLVEADQCQGEALRRGAAGFSIASTEFRLEIQTKQLEEIYDEVI